MLRKGKYMKNKKFLSVCLLSLAATSLSGCGGTTIPDVNEGKDTIVNELKGKPSDNDAKSVVFATLGKLNSYQTYTKKSQNTVSASKGFINYTQNTDATMIKNGDEYYVDSSSKSAFVDMQHIALVKNNKVAYHDKNSEIKSATYDDYYKVYGVTPDKLLSGQVFNQETILLATLTESSDNKYTYKLVLDKEKANDLLAHQTQVFGGLNGLPAYLDHTEFDLTIDDTYTPISYTYKAKYNISVNVLGDLTCTESCSATFEKFNETVEIPNSSELNKAIDETPTKIDVVTPEKVDENLTAIVNALLNFDFKNGVSLNGVVGVNDYKLPIKLSTKIDIDSLLKDGLNAVLSDVDFSLDINLPLGKTKLSYHDKAFYVDAFGNQTKFTVRDEIEPDFDLDTEGLLSFSKKDNAYIISLTPLLKSFIFEYLVSINVFDESDSDNFVTQIEFYIVDGLLGSVKGEFGIKNSNSAKFDFTIGNEAYVSPIYEDYSSTLNISSKGSASLYCELVSGKQFNLPYEISFTYDDNASSFIDTLSFDITTSIAQLSSLMFIIKSMVPDADIPDTVVVLSTCEKVSLSLRNGKIYLSGYNVATNGDYSFKVLKELPLSSTLFASLSENVTELISLIFARAFTYGVQSSVIADHIFYKLVDLFTELNNSPSIGLSPALFNYFGFNRPIKAQQISKEEDGIHINVIGYDLNSKIIYNPELESTYSTVTLFSFVISNKEITTSSEKITNLLTNDNISLASSIDDLVTEYKFLSNKDNYSLSDDYLSRVEKLESAYEKLTIDEEGNEIAKATFYASSYGLTLKNITSLKTNLIDSKQAVIDFAEAVTNNSSDASALEKTYKKFALYQIAYLQDNYGDAFNSFYDLDKAYNETNIQTTLDKIDALEDADLSSFTETQIKTRWKTLAAIKTEVNAYLDGFVSDEYISTINEYLSKTADAYAQLKLDTLSPDGINLDELSGTDLCDRIYKLNSFRTTKLNSYVVFDFVSEEMLTKYNNSFNAMVDYHLEIALSLYEEDVNAIMSLTENDSIDKFIDVYTKAANDFDNYFKKFNGATYASIFGDNFIDFYSKCTILYTLSANGSFRCIGGYRYAVFAIEKQIDALVEKIEIEQLSDDQIKSNEEIKSTVESINALRKLINLDSCISNLDKLTAIEAKLA